MGIWALLIAAATGIFSGLFGIGPSASMSRYDKDEAPAYRQEYDHSYFEDGFQANDTSAGAPINPRDIRIDEPTEPTNDTRIELEDQRTLTDVSMDSETLQNKQNKENADALTVLSGD